MIYPTSSMVSSMGSTVGSMGREPGCSGSSMVPSEEPTPVPRPGGSTSILAATFNQSHKYSHQCPPPRHSCRTFEWFSQKHCIFARTLISFAEIPGNGSNI